MAEPGAESPPLRGQVSAPEVLPVPRRPLRKQPGDQLPLYSGGCPELSPSRRGGLPAPPRSQEAARRCLRVHPETRPPFGCGSLPSPLKMSFYLVC